MSYYSNIPNRTLCQVLDEMRACYKTRNFASLGGLIEEVQSMGNRMESALYDQKDFERAKEDYDKLRKEIRKLEAQKKELE